MGKPKSRLLVARLLVVSLLVGAILPESSLRLDSLLGDVAAGKAWAKPGAPSHHATCTSLGVLSSPRAARSARWRRSRAR